MSTLHSCECGWSWRQPDGEEPVCPRCTRLTGKKSYEPDPRPEAKKKTRKR